MFVFLNACPARGAADELPEELPIVYLEEGEPAPFDGDLFPPEKSIRIGLRLEGCQERAAIDLGHATRIFEIELKRESDKAVAKLEAEQARRQLIETELERARAWYRTPEFVASVAVVLTVASVVISVYAFNALSDDLR